MKFPHIPALLWLMSLIVLRDGGIHGVVSAMRACDVEYFHCLLWWLLSVLSVYWKS